MRKGFFEPDERPVVVKIHPNLKKELDLRKERVNVLTGRKSHGGLSTFSKLASTELKLLRKSTEEIEEIIKELEKESKSSLIVLDRNDKLKYGDKSQSPAYVPLKLFNDLAEVVAVLKSKKDSPQINIDVSKVRGVKKNNLSFWESKRER